MSFLADPPLLYAAGRAIAHEPDAGRRRLLAGAALGLFYGVSVPLYLEQRWIRPFWRILGARGGRDFMLNSRILRLDADAAGPRTHVVAALLFAVVYPLALAAGMRDAPKNAAPPSARS